jgi:hypothetical protein
MSKKNREKWPTEKGAHKNDRIRVSESKKRFKLFANDF